MYGATMVNLSEDQQQLSVTIDEKNATIDLETFVSFNNYFIVIYFISLFYRMLNVMMKKFIQ